LGIAGYGAVVRRLLRVSGLVLVIYVGFLALTGWLFQKVPGGFIPTMDQGYLIVFAQLPDGASLQRNDDVRRQIGEIGRNIPGVELTFAIEGLSILDSTTKSNALTVFFPLKPFSERIGHPAQSATAIAAKLQTAFSSIQDAFVIAIQPPSVRGMGNAGGFQLEIEDRRNAGLNVRRVELNLTNGPFHLVAIGTLVGVMTRKCQNCPVRQTPNETSTRPNMEFAPSE
jgi:multidrug efflux pump subunit AcrB